MIAITLPMLTCLLSAPPLAQAAERLLTQMTSSHYQHRVEVDEGAGRYDLDCSGLVALLVQQVEPDAWEAIPHPGHRRVLAADVQGFLAGLPPTGIKGWRPVSRLGDLRPGDVVAWRHREDHPGKDTGHCVVVRRAPVPDPVRVGEWRVAVIDATASPHARDSRGTDGNGLGSGEMVFVEDADGAPMAYRWRAERSPRTRPEAFGMGRLVGGSPLTPSSGEVPGGSARGERPSQTGRP